MNLTEFTKNIPPEQIALVFKDFFEHHIAAYYILQGINFVKINAVNINKASILYSIKLLNDAQKDKILQDLKRSSSEINIYGKTIYPDIYLNGDLLCITISK